ncbi:MAG: sigma-70 family RNA polymerase sigma factor [Bifidobacteriaceae bacterium]|jgi:RNA polymerase sigma-70 factor (ECF subfamily)|nr:sigma-70 family RNA polymerase sigma factor [Bifidobacteriaceae bacterium]
MQQPTSRSGQADQAGLGREPGGRPGVKAAVTRAEAPVGVGRAGQAGVGCATWSEIAERHYPFVYRVAYRLTGHAADAEDLAQETFCRVFRAIGNYQPGGSFEAWLGRITTNLFLDAKRREARVRLEALDDDTAQVASSEAGPERLVLALGANAQLAEALGQLNPDLREALVMCDVEGRSYREIADELGVALGTVRSRLHRARAQARSVIEPAAAGT